MPTPPGSTCASTRCRWWRSCAAGRRVRRRSPRSRPAASASARARRPARRPGPRSTRSSASSTPKNAYLQCKADCREGFQQQKDLCLGHDHDCVEGCRADRDTCRQPIEDKLDADIAACNATRDGAVANCKTVYPDPEDPQRATCITNALVHAFQCRDQAREDAKPGFQDCAATFQDCATNRCPTN